MKNVKLGGPFFCPRCQCTHSSAITCTEVQRRREEMNELFESFRKPVEEQPIFTLTPDEIMEVKCAMANRIHDLEIMSKYSSRPDVFLLEGLKVCENLLKRLNNYGK